MRETHSRLHRHIGWTSLALFTLTACVHAGEPCGDLTWTPAGGAARFNHAVAFDSARNVVVQFGGTDTISKFSDTMLWNGVAWTHPLVTGPSARDAHAMAYDAARDRVILFGGLTTLGSGFVGDTWAWNGASWQQLNPADAPTPRHSTAMAYDSVRQRIVLFGGDDVTGSQQNDTWEWDGANWILRATTGPSARGSHALAFDPVRNRTVLFGGDTNPGNFITPQNDTWEWDGSTWSQRPSTTLPPVRARHTLTYDPVRQRCVLVGGSPGEGGMSRDVWEWDGVNWTRSTDLASQHYDHAAAFDSARGRLVVTGGVGPLPLGTTLERSGTTWIERTPFAPPASASWMTYDAARANVVMRQFDGPTWIWDGAIWTPHAASPNPAIRESQLSYDSARQRVVLFGGDPNSLNDTWEWDGAAWTRVHAGGAGAPPTRSQHGLAYDAARAQTVLFGGQGAGGSHRSDTWVWNGAAWFVRPVAGPSPRIRPAMAYDAVRQRVVLYGGERTQLDDTWEWDGAAWSLRAPSGPGVRYPVMTYDQVRGRVVMVGEGRAFDWDGAAWYELDAAGLPNLEIPGIAFDAARSRVTVFSGDSYSGQTFQLSPALAPPSIARQPENTIAASGDSVVIDIEAAGGKPLSYQWRKDRVPLANAGPISGANTLALTINPVAPEHFGVYDCVVTNQCGEAISNPVALSVLPPPNPCPADFNNSGAVDSQDFFDFLTAFFTGCP